MAIFFDKKTESWKAEVWFKKKRISSARFPIKALAEKFFREEIRKAEEQYLTGSSAKDYIYGELFGFWLADARFRKRPTAIIKDEQMNKQYISKFIGELKVSEISIHHFNGIITHLKKRELSKASINKVIQHFKAVFNYAFNNDLIARNPAKNFKQLKLEEKEMDFFSLEEVEQLLSFTATKYIGEERWKHAFYLCLFNTGLRLGEALGLQWSKILWDREFILVDQMWSPIENKIIETTKGRKNRLVLLSDELKKELGSVKSFSKSDFIFSDSPHSPLDPSNFRNRIWTKDLEEAGLRYIRIHDARHTFASLFMMNDGPQFSLMRLMGHASFKTTERYSHLSPNHLAGLKDVVKFRIGGHAEVLRLREPRLGVRTSVDENTISESASLQIHSTSV